MTDDNFTRNASPEPGLIARTAVLVYGGLCYVFFLGTFLYALGFVGGFVVPTHLDAAPRGPFAAALAVNLGLLGLFALQHSVMARAPFKRWLVRWIPGAAERSTYVLLSSAALCLLFWLWRPMGGEVWRVEHPVAAAALHAGFAFGWLLVLCTTFLIHHFDLFGLRQVWLFFRREPYRPLRFVTPGPYRLVRHPLYLGWLCAFWFTPTMTAAHLTFALATTVYILVAIRLEERDLLSVHGVDYERYRERTPMILPLLHKPAPAHAERRRLTTVD